MLKRFLVLLIIILSASLVFAGQGSFKANVFPAPPNLSATVNFSEPSGNKILDAEETGKLIITVKNSGKGEAFDVKAEIKSHKYINGLRFKESVSIGTIPQGQSISKEIELIASEDIPTSEIKFTINIKEANGFDADPIAIAFKTKAFEPPKLIIADIGMDDANGNSKVEPLENVELTARIQNIGHGDARNVTADIIHGSNVFIGGDGVTHFNLGNIQAGKFKDIKFMFYTNKQIKNGEKIPLEIKISEARPQFKSAKTLDIAVVIGNKNYKNTAGIPDVESADRDARIMKEYLIKTFGFKQGNIIYAEDATVGKFNEIFGSEKNPKGKLFNYVRKNISEVFIYYVGHGAPDLQSQEAYFVPVDANPQYIASNGYSLQTFYSNLSKLPAKKITIVIDACFSGNSDKGMLFKNISPVMVKVKKEYRGPQNALLITSAAVDQVSTWYPEKKHSLFTYYFLKGLQGDADANKDGAITIGEMKDYLQEHIPHMARRLNNVEQHPVVNGNEKEILVRIKN